MNRAEVNAHSAAPSPLLLQAEVAYEHGVDAGGVEAVHGVARVQTKGSPKAADAAQALRQTD